MLFNRKYRGFCALNFFHKKIALALKRSLYDSLSVREIQESFNFVKLTYCRHLKKHQADLKHTQRQREGEP